MTKTFHIMILTVLIAACGTMLLGQDDGSAPKKPLASHSAPPPAMQAPKAAPEMTRLIKAMSGNWTVTEKAEAGPMFPKGGTGKGTAKLSPGPGGLSLLENYRSSGVMGPSFTGFGAFWWDDKIQAYHGVWCDTMTPTGCDGSGTTKWEGDNLVGTMEGDMNGQPMVTTFTYSDFKPDSFVMTMASGPDSSSLKPLMTITYTRAAGMASAAKPTQ
jgi:hypothetical protein